MRAWPTAPLGSLCNVVTGGTPKRSIPQYFDGDIPWVKINDLLQGEIKDTEEKITSAGLRSSSAKMLPKGTILVSIFATIGRVAHLGVDACTNQAIAGLVLKNKSVTPGYLKYFLDSHRSYLKSISRGVAQMNINSSTLKAIEVPLPPISEQERIVSVAETAESLIRERRRSIELLDELTQSIFLDMFGDPGTNSRGWPLSTIGELVDSAQYGTSQKASLSDDLPVLRMNNVTTSGRMDLRDLKYLPLDETKEQHLVREGDILFNRTNSPELVGKTAVYRGPEPMAYAGYLIRLRPNSENTAEYISSYLNSQYGKLVLRNMCKSIIGMANINAKELRAISLPKPPLRLQKDFVGRLRKIDEMRANHLAHLAHLDELFASVQQRAFDGTLWDDPPIAS